VQVHLRVPLGRRQVQVHVHRFQDDVRRSVHLRRRCGVATVASRWTSLRGDDGHISDGGVEATRWWYCVAPAIQCHRRRVNYVGICHDATVADSRQLWTR